MSRLLSLVLAAACPLSVLAAPQTYVFDRKGRLQTRLTGARTIYEFELAVKPLLK